MTAGRHSSRAQDRSNFTAWYKGFYCMTDLHPVPDSSLNSLPLSSSPGNFRPLSWNLCPEGLEASSPTIRAAPANSSLGTNPQLPQISPADTSATSSLSSYSTRCQETMGWRGRELNPIFRPRGPAALFGTQNTHQGLEKPVWGLGSGVLRRPLGLSLKVTG